MDDDRLNDNGLEIPSNVKYSVFIHCLGCNDVEKHWVFDRDGDDYSKCKRCGHEQLY